LAFPIPYGFSFSILLLGNPNVLAFLFKLQGAQLKLASHVPLQGAVEELASFVNYEVLRMG